MSKFKLLICALSLFEFQTAFAQKGDIDSLIELLGPNDEIRIQGYYDPEYRHHIEYKFSETLIEKFRQQIIDQNADENHNREQVETWFTAENTRQSLNTLMTRSVMSDSLDLAVHTLRAQKLDKSIIEIHNDAPVMNEHNEAKFSQGFISSSYSATAPHLKDALNKLNSLVDRRHYDLVIKRDGNLASVKLERALDEDTPSYHGPQPSNRTLRLNELQPDQKETLEGKGRGLGDALKHLRPYMNSSFLPFFHGKLENFCGNKKFGDANMCFSQRDGDAKASTIVDKHVDPSTGTENTSIPKGNSSSRMGD